jgi:hypothetical protein
MIPTLWIAGGAAVLVASLIGSCEVQTGRLHTAQKALVTEKTERKAEHDAAEAAALKASAEYRAREQVLQVRVTTAEGTYAALQTVHARAIIASRAMLADNGELRNQITTFAAGGGRAGEDTAATASRRAAALGQLLAEALRADGESSNGAESNGDAVRALLAAWPQDIKRTVP